MVKYIIDAGATSGCNWYWSRVKGENVDRWLPDRKCAIIYQSKGDAEKALISVKAFTKYEPQRERFHVTRC